MPFCLSVGVSVSAGVCVCMSVCGRNLDLPCNAPNALHDAVHDAILNAFRVPLSVAHTAMSHHVTS